MDNEKEISFGAFDSELMHQEIFIPEGFEATIDGNKIILTRIENEDEKIRKALIEYFNEQCDMSDWNGVYGYQVVAWLEKQDESYTKRDVDDAYVEGMAFAKNELEKQGEQKSVGEEIVEALRTEYEKGRADAFAQMQKEWSEEDEEQVSIITNIVKAHCGKLIDCRSNLSWLKSLKDRYTWKPSDEQIRALEYIINNAHNTSYSCKIAKELLEQLKKLKGE